MTGKNFVPRTVFSFYQRTWGLGKELIFSEYISGDIDDKKPGGVPVIFVGYFEREIKTFSKILPDWA